jgi:endo-1,4-beta-xylanase
MSCWEIFQNNMKRNIFLLFSLVIVSFLILIVLTHPKKTLAAVCTFPPQETSTLADYARRKNLLIGFQTFAGSKQPTAAERSLALREGDMVGDIYHGHMYEIEPSRAVFDFTDIDRAIALAKAAGKKLRFGALVYSDGNAPAWLNFSAANCGGWTPAQLSQYLTYYIQSVMKHAGTGIQVYTVINEASQRNTYCWHQILGDSFIVDAYKAAHSANPNASLVLNDFFYYDGSAATNTRIDDFFTLLASLKQQGAPIDTIGTEMHTDASFFNQTYYDGFKKFLQRAQGAGVKVNITELDVYQGTTADYPDPLQNQKAIYKKITSICLQSPACTSIMIWGIDDSELAPRFTNPANAAKYKNPQPLLFSANLQRKPAYYGIMEALKEDSSRGCYGPSPTLPLTPTPTPATRIPGDLTDSGDVPGDQVNIFDYSILMPDMGKTGAKGFIPSDIDKNGVVDIFDRNILMGNFPL